MPTITLISKFEIITTPIKPSMTSMVVDSVILLGRKAPSITITSKICYGDDGFSKRVSIASLNPTQK